jgi:hypothetical protein
MLRLSQIGYNFSSTKHIIFFILGAPGVEKDTYGKLLRKDLNFDYLSMGNLFTKIYKG